MKCEEPYYRKRILAVEATTKSFDIITDLISKEILSVLVLALTLLCPYHSPLALMEGENQAPPKSGYRIISLPQSHHDYDSYHPHIEGPHKRLHNLGHILATNRSVHRRIDAFIDGFQSPLRCGENFSRTTKE